MWLHFQKVLKVMNTVLFYNELSGKNYTCLSSKLKKFFSRSSLKGNTTNFISFVRLRIVAQGGCFFSLSLLAVKMWNGNSFQVAQRKCLNDFFEISGPIEWFAFRRDYKSLLNMITPANRHIFISTSSSFLLWFLQSQGKFKRTIILQGFQR